MTEESSGLGAELFGALADRPRPAFRSDGKAYMARDTKTDCLVAACLAHNTACCDPGTFQRLISQSISQLSPWSSHAGREYATTALIQKKLGIELSDAPPVRREVAFAGATFDMQQDLLSHPDVVAALVARDPNVMSREDADLLHRPCKKSRSLHGVSDAINGGDGRRADGQPLAPLKEDETNGLHPEKESGRRPINSRTIGGGAKEGKDTDAEVDMLQGFTAASAGYKGRSSSGDREKSDAVREANGKAGRRRLGSRAGGFQAPRPKGESDTGRDEPQKNLPEISNVPPNLVEMVMNEVMETNPGVDWDDIAGLAFPKRCVMEAVIWPMLRPDIFTGLRGPPKGLLLFGPPGTGKTMIGKAIASKSGSTFLNISASSLTSKWVGEGEKTVRALFAVARHFQPSVIFIDEIDSLLTQRTDTDQESTRRLKTEFLVQMDGAATNRNDRVLVVGATNRPQELDEAARRRLVKRLYIPLPDRDSRKALVKRLLENQTHKLSEVDVDSIVELSSGYSGSDLYSLCAEAALGPVRELGDRLGSIDISAVRLINYSDFAQASRMARASVSNDDLDGYEQWNTLYGSFPFEAAEAPRAGNDLTTQ